MSIKGFKGFDKDMRCRGMQYAENAEFEEESAELCYTGLHYCEAPFDVLKYYGFIDDNCDLNQFSEVEDIGQGKKGDDKSVTTKLKVGGKIGIKGLVEAHIELVREKTTMPDISDGKDFSSGDWAQIGSSGNLAKIGSSGDGAQIGSSGDLAQIGSSGDGAQIGSSGDGAQIGSSGDGAQIGSSGDWAKIGSSGDLAKIGSSGDLAKIGSSGDWAKIGSSGDWAQIGSSGDWAKIGSSGKNCVVCCAGHGSAVRAKIGSWITLSEWSDVGGEYTPICVKTEKVDGERIKEDVWYKLVGGEFVEV